MKEGMTLEEYREFLRSILLQMEDDYYSHYYHEDDNYDY
jgi:hypothetical protein